MFLLIFTVYWRRQFPLGKITSQGRPEDVPEKRIDVLRTFPYGPICNAKGRIRSGISLRRTQDVNLPIIHKMGFHGIFSIFLESQLYISDCTAEVSWKPLTSYFGPVMVRDVSTKMGPLGNVLRTLRAGWVAGQQMNMKVLSILKARTSFYIFLVFY